MASKYRCGRCRKTRLETSFSPSQRKNGAYCRDCMSEVNRKKFGPHPSRPCGHCGVAMRDPNPKARFCSVECKNGARIAADSERRRRENAKRVCAGCGASLAGRRADTKWCSMSCANRGPSRKAVKRRANLKGKYGLTQDQFNALLRKQNGLCALCRAEQPGTRDWSVDHDHITGQVRGLLCSRCNTGLGQFRDDPELLTRAARYVRRFRKSAALDQSG